MMSRKLLFGLPAVFLAAALGAALLSSSETSWGFLTATHGSVFCSSGPAETVSASASASRTLPSCPPAVTGS